MSTQVAAGWLVAAIGASNNGSGGGSGGVSANGGGSSANGGADGGPGNANGGGTPARPIGAYESASCTCQPTNQGGPEVHALRNDPYSKELAVANRALDRAVGASNAARADVTLRAIDGLVLVDVRGVPVGDLRAGLAAVASSFPKKR